MANRTGFAALRVEQVAASAGVTKGGLFHHFRTKHDLVEAIVANHLRRFDADIEAYLARDQFVYGCFTRAYVNACLSTVIDGDGPASVTILADPAARDSYLVWLRSRIERHRTTDGHASLEIVRYAASGAMVARAIGSPTDLGLAIGVLRTRLLSATWRPDRGEQL